MSPLFSSDRLACLAAVAAACGLCAIPVRAQSTAGAASEIVITGNPLGREQAPASVGSLSGAELRERGAASLGETLSGLPGVSSTYFGPQASRPILRGLDGDRVRLLSNSASVQDVSSLSYDHAVPTDVLSAERVEVLRGPAALLYGGSAMGGVVNVIDNRIPRERIGALQGQVRMHADSGNQGRSAAALLESGAGPWAWHVDGFERRAGDVAVPRALACGARMAWVLCNSAARAQGGAAGISHIGEQGRLGLSASSYSSDYGSVAEDTVTVGMRSNRLALDGEWRQPLPLLQSLSLQASQSDYQHTEFESGQPGTVFSRNGHDLRLQARHVPLALGASALEGVLGVQLQASRFDAEGQEVFAPRSRQRSQAVFAFEEWRHGAWLWSGGLRFEQVKLHSDGSSATERFALGGRVGERDFAPRSWALGLERTLGQGWLARAQLADTARAPGEAELFADGPHLATRAWEQGKPTLGMERSRNAELGLQWRSGHHRMQWNVFDSRFDNFIALMDTAAQQGSLPLQTYQGVRARLRGYEGSGQWRLWTAPGALDLLWRLDQVRGDNLSAGEPLPRIAPWRAGATLAWSQDAWSARLGLDHAAAQARVPAGSVPTAAYTLWSASLSHRQRLGPGTLQAFARLDNASNALAFSATSVLTSTAPGRVPLPGRSLRLGLQWQF